MFAPATSIANKSLGFTLIELMVSLALGSVLVSGIASMYLETRKNMGQDEEMARLQENARYAINFLKHEISSAGFLGGLKESGDLAAEEVGTDCASSDWVTDVSNVIELANNVSASGNPSTLVGTALTCITGNDLQATSDILTIKRTADTPTLRDGQLNTAAEDLNQWYLRISDFSDYTLTYLESDIPDDEATAGSTVDYWEYYAKIFYLRNYSIDEDDDIPTLCEASLVNSAITHRCLVEGIEDLQFELGIDSDDDFVADQYKSTPAAADFDNAVSVRVHILLRSVNTISDYTNTKSYRLGSKSVDAFNDAYIRKVFTTTVMLRNFVTI